MIKMKLYTKYGDYGKSFDPVSKKKTPKHADFFEVIGSLDELQSWLGLLRGKVKK
ncbi:MAG: ATP:cob(I)alamin adenosyltransferase, partial [Candidatus Aenigmarchaeota archaeon]|nr:ATP:cob(I)alamin adenosyltransferase [Candidatus Aenigmarchaeota archaeon]